MKSFTTRFERIKQRRKFVLLGLLFLVLVGAKAAFAQEPVVHAILFYSPTCPHCHKVMATDLPPIMHEYGDQLVLLAFDTSTEEGWTLYLAVVEHFQIPESHLGVPMLIAGDTVLVGSMDIPEHFPQVIEQGLLEGGLDWPAIPILLEQLQAEGLVDPVEPTPKIESAGPNSDGDALAAELGEAIERTEQATWMQRFGRDVIGNSLSLVVLIGMVYSVARVGHIVGSGRSEIKSLPKWLILVLIAGGLFFASYMAYVEIIQIEAICGPVGDCNTVQQSPYSRLFGLMPVAVLGVITYLALGLLWLVSEFGPVKWHRMCLIGFWGLYILGTLFLIYLTFLEPFVIGATCAWCLATAITMTFLMWAATSRVILINT